MEKRHLTVTKQDATSDCIPKTKTKKYYLKLFVLFQFFPFTEALFLFVFYLERLHGAVFGPDKPIFFRIRLGFAL